MGQIDYESPLPAGRTDHAAHADVAGATHQPSRTRIRSASITLSRQRPRCNLAPMHILFRLPGWNAADPAIADRPMSGIAPVGSVAQATSLLRSEEVGSTRNAGRPATPRINVSLGQAPRRAPAGRSLCAASLPLRSYARIEGAHVRSGCAPGEDFRQRAMEVVRAHLTSWREPPAACLWSRGDHGQDADRLARSARAVHDRPTPSTAVTRAVAMDALSSGNAAASRFGFLRLTAVLPKPDHRQPAPGTSSVWSSVRVCGSRRSAPSPARSPH